MIRKPNKEKLAPGLWKISFISHGLKIWLVFIDDPGEKTILELNRYPRYKKGKGMRHVFRAMGISHIADIRTQKKCISEIINAKKE